MAALAPGFRFHPTDEELISYYLKRKICRKPFKFDTISEIDIYKYEPWVLPGLSLLMSRDLEWYFFSALDRKYGNGSRTNRATSEGYWKTTGKDRSVRSIRRGDLVVGMKKTLVYHKGRAPRGERTNWVMHEYRIVDEALERGGVVQDGVVLCRVFQKSGSGPKNGEQYGAPFIEEEWEDGEEEKVFVPNGDAEENLHQVVNAQEYDQHQNDDDLETACGVRAFQASCEMLLRIKLKEILGRCSNGVTTWKRTRDFVDDCIVYAFLVLVRAKGKSLATEFLGQLCSRDLNHGLAIASENELPPGTGHMYNQNQYQESQGFDEADQKLFIGKGKAEVYPDKQHLFASLEEYLMEGIPCEEEYFEIDELLNPMDSSHYGDDLVGEEASHVDSNSNTPVKEYLEIDDLPRARDDQSEMKRFDEQIVAADPPGFEMLDEYLNYFDSFDDLSPYDISDTLEPLETKDLIPDKPYLTKEVDNGVWKAHLASPECPKTHSSEGASSSEQKPEFTKVEPDSQYDGPDNTLAKTVRRVLGSIPAPPAYASEFPVQKGSFGQASPTRSSSSIHVTAGMIHITDITSGSRKEWPLQKAGGVDLLLHHDIARSGLTPAEGLIGNAITPVASMLSGGTGLVMLRSGFFLVFLWVLILSVSYRIGSYIYTR
ncbi:hypothetical protein Sjap_013711 [Stephania japonica]|uniref:NAC domain-containing protein n=1 Tax=Stephania japonica TaxID=461633 RepID=A0AAP0IYI0_9MAGN